MGKCLTASEAGHPAGGRVVSSSARLIAQEIGHADSVAALKAAAPRIDALVAQLHGSGVGIDRIARLVSRLNTCLYARLWALLAPPALVEASCLLVMGSEGRREQILKTDQDNALLVRDGFEFAGLDALAARFSDALGELGYPPCPGGIMLGNPLWRQPLASFRATLRDWIYGAEPEGPMRLAIFLDAAAVAGDAALLVGACRHLDTILNDDDAFLARFAGAADQFSEPAVWWHRISGSRPDDLPLDLKKLGTFPIVHGVRALALQYRVHAVGTAHRLRALVERQRVEAALAGELVDALHFFMALKLTHQLRQRQRGEPAGNVVRFGDLDAAERAPFEHALATIRRFRAFLRRHFRLDAL
jgi:CBS domain-containing protein